MWRGADGHGSNHGNTDGQRDVLIKGQPELSAAATLGAHEIAKRSDKSGIIGRERMAVGSERSRLIHVTMKYLTAPIESNAQMIIDGQITGVGFSFVLIIRNGRSIP
jgi:hypothetical protein